MEDVHKKEELKRLKNLKKKEIHEKILKIEQITGNKKVTNKQEELENLIEEDFDPNNFDKKMEELFDEEYYQDDDIEKPVFSDSDGYDEDQFVPAAVKSKGFKKVQQLTKKKEKKEGNEEIEKVMDEYYKLDYEDMVTNSLLYLFERCF